MTDITLTSITYLSGAAPLQLTAGATIAATEVAYLDASTGTVKLADADALTSASVAGLALNGSTTGNPVALAGPGSKVTVNAALTKGVTYFLSPNAGKLCPFADLAAGDYVSLVGIAESTTVLRILCVNTDVAL